MSSWAAFGVAAAELIAWCAACAPNAGDGVTPALGLVGGVTGALAAAGSIPALANPPPMSIPFDGDDSPAPATTLTGGDGAASSTVGPREIPVSATDTGGNTYAAALPDGSMLNGNADGTSTVTAADGSTTTYDAAGNVTDTAPPSLDTGGSINAAALHHDVTNTTSDGGYNVSHPDGSVDVHHPDGSAIHVDADGSTWHPLP